MIARRKLIRDAVGVLFVLITGAMYVSGVTEVPSKLAGEAATTVVGAGVE